MSKKWTKYFDPIWNTSSFLRLHEFGPPVGWTSRVNDLGPQLGSTIWVQDLGPQVRSTSRQESNPEQLLVFKALALWADGFYKSICTYVCLCVCVSVCLFTFEVPFKCLCAPTSQSWMSKIVELQNPWGKVMERSGLRFENFY